MLSQYLAAALGLAHFELLDDGSYYGEVVALPGVWADGDTLEQCRQQLQEVLEDWVVLTLRSGDPLPPLGGIDLNLVGQRVR